jgi:hypothetical protein
MARQVRSRLGTLAFRVCLSLVGGLLSIALAGCGRSMVPLASSGTQSTGPGDNIQGTETAAARLPFANPGSYMIVWAPADGSVPVREPAGTQGAEVDSLRRDQRGIRLTGRTTKLGSSDWVEIVRPGGGTGWVNAWNLSQDVSGAEFCSDGRVTDLIGRLRAAVASKDGQALTALISPRHGLVIRLDWWNPEVAYPRQAIAQLFRNQDPVDWGTDKGSGALIQGAFSVVVLPALQSGLGEAGKLGCNALASGETARPPQWPGEYANLNYYSIYIPASPLARFSWRTWAVGFEYVDGEPFVTVLVLYRGEI